MNLSEQDYLRRKSKWLPQIHAWAGNHGAVPTIPYSVDFEMKLAAMADDQERAAYLESQRDKKGPPVKSMLDRIIASGYEVLDLIHFMTCGPDEVRCWTVRNGCR